jgi:hypothetical protein
MLNVVLQVNKSHLHRVVKYIPSIMNRNNASATVVDILKSSDRKTLSLVFVRLLNGTTFKQFVNSLGKDTYIHKALNKVYAVGGNYNIIQGKESDLCSVARQAVENLLEEHDLVLQVEAFPPSIQWGILNNLETTLPTEVSIAPTGNTHILNVVRVDEPLRNKKETDNTIE